MLAGSRGGGGAPASGDSLQLKLAGELAKTEGKAEGKDISGGLQLKTSWQLSPDQLAPASLC